MMRSRGEAGDSSGFLGHSHSHPQPCPATFSPAETCEATASSKSDVSSSCRHPGRLFRVKTLAKKKQAGHGLMKAEGWLGGLYRLLLHPLARVLLTSVACRVKFGLAIAHQ